MKPLADGDKQSEWVLLGAGHTHLHILEQWRQHPVQGVHLTCVSNRCFAAYSGMLPGVLAGDYSTEQMQVDLVRRCEAVGARLVLGETVGLDRSQRRLLLQDQPPLCYDQLSIGIGSVPATVAGSTSVDQHGQALSIKPMQTFLKRLEQQVSQAIVDGSRLLKVAVVGGGAGGTEIALCLPAWMSNHWPKQPYELSIIHSGSRLCKSFSERASRLIATIVQRRQYRLHLNSTAVEVDASGVVVQSLTGIRQHMPADVVIWAVGAVGPPLFAALDLSKDPRGFLLTDQHLRSVDDPAIFVVGDAGTCAPSPNPKAGVYAVRQGPVLWDNLQSAQAGESHVGRSLADWQPQSSYLALMNTGNRRAILAYRQLATQGRWCWRLKDFIDRRFMRKHQRY